jgi:hypothetical protein
MTITEPGRAARCPFREAVDRHFAGRVRPEEEAALRAHLPGCPLCHARYERQLLVAQLARDPLAGVDRLAIGLGLSAGRTARVMGDGRWLAGGVMLAACLAWVLGHDPEAPAPAPAPAAAAAVEPAAAHPAAAPSELVTCLRVIEDHQRQQCRVVPVSDWPCAGR